MDAIIKRLMENHRVERMNESKDSRVCIWREGTAVTEVSIYQSGDSEHTYEIEIKDKETDSLDTSLMDKYDLSDRVFDDRREAVKLAYDIYDDLTGTYPNDDEYKEELNKLLDLLKGAGVDLGRNSWTTAGSPYRDEDCPNDVLHKVVLLLGKNGYTKVSRPGYYGPAGSRTKSQVTYRKRIGDRSVGVTIRRDSKAESGTLYVDR